MTNKPARERDIVERLLRTSPASSHIFNAAPVNPDGPDAVAFIKEQSAEITRLRELLEAKAITPEIDRALRKAHRDGAEYLGPIEAKAPSPQPDTDVVETVALERFQRGVDQWMDACFTPEIKADVQERCDRFVEEALEFVQAAGYSAERAHALVDYTFGRPQGEINQEVGGVMVTLAAMCNTLDVNIGRCSEAELARVWTKIGAIRAKQAAKPTGSALPIATAALNASTPEIQRLTDLLYRAMPYVLGYECAPSEKLAAEIGAALKQDEENHGD